VHRDQLRELDADRDSGKLAPDDYERSRRELEKRLLDDVDGTASRERIAGGRGGHRPAAIAGALVPVLAIAIYFAVGNPGAIGFKGEEHAVGMAQIEAMVQRLAERQAQNPDDVEGWKMLGKSYSVLGRFAEAANAYSKAAIRAPRDPQLLADLADALAMARGQSMAGEPEELVLRALQIDPKNLKALALAGTAAFERRDFRSAARFWERMLPLVEAGSEDARTIQANIDEARKGLSAKTAPAKGVQGTVRLSPKLASRASPDDTVFIFARAAQGPPMPLAVVRKRVRDLPASFALDDSMAMAAGMKLSGHPKVIIGARISKSGNATPQPGDLQGLSGTVQNTAQGVTVTIDTEIK
jgi:cytochrome c-type biogenesis protein CcmH